MRANSKLVLWQTLAVAVFLLLAARARAQGNGAKPQITSSINPSQLTVLKGNTYPLARSQYDRGPAPASLPMQRMILVLKRSSSQQKALGALLDQQQEKSSPNYHKWLTPARFGQQFGASPQDIQTIENWLETQGFQIDRVASGRGVIEFSGDAGQVQQAFHTTIHQYTVNGKSRWANASDPEIPSALAPAVAGIVSLNSFPRKPMHQLAGIFRKSKSTGEVTPVQPNYTIPCGYNSSGQIINCYALGPYDFGTIYNVLPLWNAGTDGTGQTIAIVSQSDINPGDVTKFRSLFSMPVPNLQIIHNGPDPGLLKSTGDETESDIDVEWAGAVAKGAKIDLVVSESTEATAGVDLSAEYIVDNDLAPIMSMSYGACELDLGTAGNQFYAQLWQQAAAEGITVMVASGDAGSAGCDIGDKGATHGLAVSGTASTPYDVAVGGTDFNDATDPTTYWNSTNNTTTQESAKSYIPEMPWNNTCTNPVFGPASAEENCNTLTTNTSLLNVVGGSGGASNCTAPTGQTVSSCAGGYAKPSWQTGTGVPSDGHRDMPDVSLFAGSGFSGNFYMACESDIVPCGLDSFLAVGGTSVSAPAFAGIMAMVDQKTGSRRGDADYDLYPLAALPGASCNSSGTIASSCIFYDTTYGTNAMPCVTGSPDCTTNTSGDAYGVLSGYNATAGYDLATGLGSVNATNLVNNWNKITFQPSSTTLTLNGGSSVNITHGTPVSVDISVSPTSPVPTGSVSLLATPSGRSVDAGTFTLSNGSVSSSTSMLPGGTSYNVIAHYAGDGTYAASDSNPVTVTVNPEASQTFANLETFDINGNLTSHSATSATYGDGYYLLRIDVGNSTATYSASTGISSTCSNHTSNCPTGTVSVSANGVPLAGSPFTLNSEGNAEDQPPPFLPGGTYAISANYPGDSSYSASTDTANFTISQAPTTLTLLDTGPFPYGDSGVVSANLKTVSEGVEPTGTVSFFIDGSPAPTLASTSYTGRAGQLAGQGTAYAYLSAQNYVGLMSVGTHSLTAQYSGDSNYASAASASTITVTPAPPSIYIGVSPGGYLSPNLPETLTADVSGSQFGVAPTGTVTFYIDNTELPGTVTYTPTPPGPGQWSSLQASIPWTPTALGNHIITAKYSGDTNYMLATGALTVDIKVPDFALAANSLTINIASAGGVASVTVTATEEGGFSGTVNLTVACPGSDEITCSISPSSVDLGASATTGPATVSIRTTAPSMLAPTDMPSGSGWPGAAAAISLAALCCLAIVLLMLSKSERRWSTALGLLILYSVLALASCGGGGGGTSIGSGGNPPPPSNPGTPPGTYSLVVTGTSGSLTHSVTIQVNVQ